MGCIVVRPVVPSPPVVVTCTAGRVALFAVWMTIGMLVALGQTWGSAKVRNVDGENDNPVPSMSCGPLVPTRAVVAALPLRCGVLKSDVSAVIRIASWGSRLVHACDPCAAGVPGAPHMGVGRVAVEAAGAGLAAAVAWGAKGLKVLVACGICAAAALLAPPPLSPMAAPLQGLRSAVRMPPYV